MSTSAQIRFKESGPAKDPEGYIHGEAIAYLLPKLDEVAQQLGITPPGTFTFEDASFYKKYRIKMSPKVLDKIKTQPEWHACRPAVEVFRRLYDHFKQMSQADLLNMQRATRVAWDDMILEMKLFADILEEGAKRNDTFRIEAVP